MARMSRESVAWLCLSGSVFMGAGYYNVHAARLQDAGGAARAAQTSTAPAAATAAEQRALLDKYCVTCHNQRAKTAGLMLDSVDIEHLGEAPETWEKVAHMLRTGSMPPTGRPRPEPAASARPGDVSRRRPRPRRRGGAQRRAHPAASAEPYGIRQCRSRSAGRRHPADAAAGGQLHPRVRQHRRRAHGVTDAARTLHGGRPPGEPPRRRRPDDDGRTSHLQHRLVAPADGSCERRPAFRRSWHHRPAQLPPRRRVRRPGTPEAHAERVHPRSRPETPADGAQSGWRARQGVRRSGADDGHSAGRGLHAVRSGLGGLGEELARRR